MHTGSENVQVTGIEPWERRAASRCLYRVFIVARSEVRSLVYSGMGAGAISHSFLLQRITGPPHCQLSNFCLHKLFYARFDHFGEVNLLVFMKSTGLFSPSWLDCFSAGQKNQAFLLQWNREHFLICSSIYEFYNCIAFENAWSGVKGKATGKLIFSFT